MRVRGKMALRENGGKQNAREAGRGGRRPRRSQAAIESLFTAARKERRYEIRGDPGGG